MKLFPKEDVVGIFRGFSEGGLEFHAELVLPYKNIFQSTPMHGQFVIIQLESEDEGVLGRITSISSQGRLASSAGEDYGLRAVSDDRQIPEDLREQYLKYLVDIRVLGVLRIVDEKPVFASSHRRLPHVGSKVAFLSDELLKEIAGNNLEGIDLGFFALGEFIYCGDDPRLEKDSWMRIKSPKVLSKFNIQSLVARRTFIFARAGFGKSNLNKLLFSSLYKEPPTVEKRAGQKVPVGTIIFDPEGEYFWPDDKNRPGLCDVPELEDKIVVFTRKRGPSPFYESFKAGDIKLDIRRLRPSEVISIALAPEKQDQQNVRKLKGLNDDAWKQLVDEIKENGNNADPALLMTLLRLEQDQKAEMVAARANMTTIVNMLHDPSSQMMDMLIYALKEGKICIIDVSQLRGEPALILSGLILQKIFDHNQREFTEAQPHTIPTIAVIEEAQSVLGHKGGSRPYIEWVKEGRKYDLGSVMVTQQPGSISGEILSQGDNWFVFHLLSSYDLQALKKANAHFSDDLLSTLLNEPIIGNGIFWSSVKGKSYPIPIRILSFEAMYKTRDPKYQNPPGKTYALELQKLFKIGVPEKPVPKPETEKEGEEQKEETNVDILDTYLASAIDKLRTSPLIERVKKEGATWFELTKAMEDALPPYLDKQEKNRIAYNAVRTALDTIVGQDKWNTEKRDRSDGKGTRTWVVLKI